MKMIMKIQMINKSNLHATDVHDMELPTFQPRKFIQIGI